MPKERNRALSGKYFPQILEILQAIFDEDEKSQGMEIFLLAAKEELSLSPKDYAGIETYF